MGLQDGSKADWSKFACDEEFNRIDMSGEVDETNESIIKAIGKSAGKRKVKMAPWWNKESSEAIKHRNKVLRQQ